MGLHIWDVQAIIISIYSHLVAENWAGFFFSFSSIFIIYGKSRICVFEFRSFLNSLSVFVASFLSHKEKLPSVSRIQHCPALILKSQCLIVIYL